MPVKDIYNQVRSLADPYPNARTIANKKIVLIKEAIQTKYRSNFLPGKIILNHNGKYVFSKNEILVSTRDKFLLVKKYKITDQKKNKLKAKFFKSVKMQNTIDKILKRFKKEFPDKKLNNSLKKFWKTRGFKVN